MRGCNCSKNQNKIVTLAKKIENMAKNNKKYIWAVELDDNAIIQFMGNRIKKATATHNIMKALYESGSELVTIETASPKKDEKEK